MSGITDEQVERAAKALYEASLDGPRNQLRSPWGACSSRDHFMEQARIALEAAQETERSKWPTDDSVEEMYRMTEEAAHRYMPAEDVRRALRAAMLVDPIIKRVLDLRHMTWDDGDLANGIASLMSAIRNAGLLDG